jgi:hypothetical protein
MERREIAPAEGGDTYMVRYVLVGTPWGDVKVHHILRPDQTRDLHDHPWPFLAVILRGGYTEEVPWVRPNGEPMARHYRTGAPLSLRRTRRPGHAYLARATYTHRIHELHGDCWSLVLSGRRCRAWGFWMDGQWVHWKSYVARGTDSWDAAAGLKP